MELKYQYSEADAREAVVAFRKRVFAGRQRKLAIVIVLILICFLLLYLLDPYSRWFYFLSGFFLGVMVLTIGVWVRVAGQTRVNLKSSPLLQQAFTATLDSEALTVDCPIAHSRRRWQVFTEYLETENLFLLKESEGRYMWLPKRGFEKPEDVDAARALFKEQVKGAH